MHTVMLWFIKQGKEPMSDEIQKAVDYYEKKYGQKPDLCLIHPSMLGDHADGMSFSSDGLTIRTYRMVLPGHLWIGVEEKREESKETA